jgi:predicted nucleic acid-binding Zn ribbon protein
MMANEAERFMTTSLREPPQQIGGAIQDLLVRFDAKGSFAIVRLIRLWPEVVGEAIARRTEVSDLKFHTAVVKVSGAMWIQELNLMKPQILSRLRDALGDDVVRELRFIQGRLSRREPSKLKPVGRNRRLAVDLPGLADPELRSAFASLIEAWGRAPR